MTNFHPVLGGALCATALLLAMCKGADSTTEAPQSGGGATTAAGGAAAATGGTAGLAASSGAAGSTNGGAGGTSPSEGGTSGGGAAAGGAAGTGGANATSASKRAACRTYAFASCSKGRNCEGISGWDCAMEILDDCPDIVFSPGSTRTVEGLLACSNEIEAFSCDQWRLGLRPECVTPGTRQLGETCLYHSQCASLRCSARNTCGQCVAPIAEGQSCAELPFACADGLGCVNDETCLTPTLDPIQEYMDPDPIAEGGACAGTDRCVVGTSCVDPEADGTGACEPPGTLDMPCKPSIASAAEYCESGLYCDGEHVCRTLPTEGQPCAALTPDFHGCAAGFTCDAQTDLCATQLPVGSACTNYLQCVENKCRSPGNDYNDCIDDPEFVALGLPQYTDCICSRPRYEYQDCVAGIDTCETATECTEGKCTAVDLIGLFAAACGN